MRSGSARSSAATLDIRSKVCMMCAMDTTALFKLFRSRPRPEDAAKAILDAGLFRAEAVKAAKAAKESLEARQVPREEPAPAKPEANADQEAGNTSAASGDEK